MISYIIIFLISYKIDIQHLINKNNFTYTCNTPVKKIINSYIKYY
jgi:hypothetical protein